MDTVEQLRNLLNAAKGSLEALGVTKIWYQLDGGWCDNHYIIIETIHDVEEEVPTVTLDRQWTKARAGRTIGIIRLRPEVEAAVKNAFSSIEQELFDNRTTFFYASPSFCRTDLALIYPISAIIEQKEEKIISLQRRIDCIRQEIEALRV